MKILMQNRVDLFDKPGGDLVQMQKTKVALEEMGHSVSISTDLRADLTGFDVVHLFNITRVHETLAQLKWAKQYGIPVVVSPIYHKVAEIERYERLGRTGGLSRVNRVLRKTSQREALKNCIRLKDSRQRSAIWSMLRRGFVESQKYVLAESDGWVVLADAEQRAIENDFGVTNRTAVAPNAVDAQFFAAKPDKFIKKYNLKDFVLCVSRIEDRKNQIRLIEAMKGMGMNLVFIGGLNPHHAAYVGEFERLVRRYHDWVYYLGPLPYEQLPAAYAAARVHVLPSWFEVVSLTALEAAASGCAGAVADTGYMREYLGDEVSYCDPADTESIRNAIMETLGKESTGLSQHVRQWTWRYAATQTVLAYEMVL